MITVNGKVYVKQGSSEDNGLYENFYYEDKLVQIYNIEIDGQRGTLTKTSIVYKELGTDIILSTEKYPIQWELKCGVRYQSGICIDYASEKVLQDLIDTYSVDDTEPNKPTPEVPEEEEDNTYKEPEDEDQGKGLFDDTMGSEDNEYNRGLLPAGADINNPNRVLGDRQDTTQGQPQENSLKNKGTTYPIIRINDYYVMPEEIQHFSMETGYYKNYYDYETYRMPMNGFIPTFKLIVVSANPQLLKTDFIKQGDRCAVFFSASHSMVKSIRCDFRVTNVITNNMDQNRKQHFIKYIITGELYVPDLRNEEIRYNFNGSSRDAMMDAAKRLRLSYFFCDPEDTDDTMVWCNCKSVEFFIKDLTTHAWKNPDSFFESWIDPRYGLSFQNINKLLGEDGLDEQIDLTFWINTFLINRGMDNQAEKTEEEKAQTDRPQAKLFTNIPTDDEANTVYHINKWRLVNNAQEIQDFIGLNCKQQFEAVNPGLKDNPKYNVEFSLCINKTKFDPTKNPKNPTKKSDLQPNPFYVLLGPARNMTYADADTAMQTSETESSNKKEPEKITNPQSDGDAEAVTSTDGNMLSSGNTHKFYEVAYEHNMRNLLQLQKQYLLVELNGANLTILRGEKIPVILLDVNRAMAIISGQYADADKIGSLEAGEKISPTTDENIKKYKTIQDLISSYIYEAESGWYIIDGIEWVYDPALAEYDPTGTCWRTNVKITRREWPVPGYKQVAEEEIILVQGENGQTIKKAIADLKQGDIILDEKGNVVRVHGVQDVVVMGKDKSKKNGDKTDDKKSGDSDKKGDDNKTGDKTEPEIPKLEVNSDVSQDVLNELDKSVAVVDAYGNTTYFDDPTEDLYLYTSDGVEIIHGTTDSGFFLDLVNQYVQNKDRVKNSGIPLTGLKDFMKELYRLIAAATDNKIKLVSARRWAVNELGQKIDGNAFVKKNGYYKCMNAIGDVLYFKSNNSRHLYGEAIDIINVDMDFSDLMTKVIMRNKDILLLMYQNGVSAYIEQSKDDIGTTTKHYHLGTDTIKQKEFWASVKAVLGSDKIPGTLINFTNYMKNNNKQSQEIKRYDVTETS